MKFSINFAKKILILWIAFSLVFPVLLNAQDQWDDEWDDEWERTEDTGINGKKREEWISFKGEAVINAPINIVSYFFKDVEKSAKFIPGIRDKKIFEEISSSERIEYTYTKLPWPFRDRYTVYRFKEEYNNGNEVLLTMNSVKEYPYKDGSKTLGTLKDSRFLLKSLEVDKSKTHVTVDMNINPGGLIPHWLLKPHTKKWAAKLLRNLEKNILLYQEKQAGL